METPPRAWGRRGISGQAREDDGNTPTGVGKTAQALNVVVHNRKHPHGRGEDAMLWRLMRFSAETPPRAWGRQALMPGEKFQIGNTPTGVGKTAC